MLEQRIQQHFIDAADLQYQAAQALAAPIAAAVQAVVACLTGGGKVLACGLGASAAAAQQFAALCVAGFERERPELAALALVRGFERGQQGGLVARHGQHQQYVTQLAERAHLAGKSSLRLCSESAFGAQQAGVGPERERGELGALAFEAGHAQRGKLLCRRC